MGKPYDSFWPRYVPAGERRRRAAKKLASMKKTGRDVSPIEITGRKIAATFWGEAWCKNLEAYSDYASRLPRGRTYVRNGSVLDLQIEAGRVRALVSGTELYTVDVVIRSLADERWKEIKQRCAGQIDSLVELLQGSISKSVMEIVTRKGEGLFPSPREINLNCSCPDWAEMCKHVAAALYGVGARLDHRPELLFTLRGADPTEMVEAAVAQPTGSDKTRKGRALETDQLSSIFGVDIEMDGVSKAEASTSIQPKVSARRARRSTAKKKRATRRITAETAAAAETTTRKKTQTSPPARKATSRKPRAATASAKKTKVVRAGPKKAAKKRSAAEDE